MCSAPPGGLEFPRQYSVSVGTTRVPLRILGMPSVAAGGRDVILQRMRRSTLWFVIAALWFLLTGMNVMQHHGGLAVLTCVVSLAFVAVGILLKRREQAESHSRRRKL